MENDINSINHSINYRLVLSLCGIIAITGDSGTGKTTLMKRIEKLFDKDVLKFECDSCHKWERNNDNWKDLHI